MKTAPIVVMFAALGMSAALAGQTATQATPPRPEARPEGRPEEGRGARPAQLPFMPVAANTLAAHPEPFIGRTVSVTAAVDQRFGDTAFSVDQEKAKSGGQDVLVLAPFLAAPVQADAYVTIIGEAVKFDLAAVAARMKDAMPPLSPDVVTRYQGRAAIIAQSVINTAMTDLAKRPPPPMTAEEEAFSKLMKQIGPGFNGLRQAVTASNAADTSAQAAALKKLFTDAAAFWKTKTHPDAIQWNDDARKEAEAIATAAGKTDWDAIKASVPKLQQNCTNCHGQYRERLDDGTYRFKQPAK